MLSITILIIVILAHPQSGSKVGDRFNGLPPHQFSVIIPKVEGLQFYNRESADGFEELAANAKGMNVSLEFVPYSTLGQCYPNGSYNGIIGMIQRNEYSSTIVPVRYDSTPCEPGIFVESYLGAHAPKIYSTFNRIRNGTQKTEIVFVVTSFSSSTWIYLIVTYTICGIILTACAICLNQIEMKWCSVVQHFFKSLWELFMLFVDMVPTVVSKFTAPTVLWTALVLAAYYGYHCVLFNTLSADLSVPPQEVYIDSLDDLLNDTLFEDVVPFILTQTATYPVLAKSRVGTVEWELFQKMNQTANESFITLDGSKNIKDTVMPMVNRLLPLLVDGRHVLVEDSVLLDPIISYSFCHVDELRKKFIDFHVSKEMFAGGPQAFIVSNGTHPTIVRLFRYRAMTGREMDLPKGYFAGRQRSFLNQYDQSTSSEGFQCAEKLERKSPIETIEQNFIPIRIDFFKHFFFICVSILIVALYALIFEHYYFASHDGRKRSVVSSEYPVEGSHREIEKRIPRISSLDNFIAEITQQLRRNSQ